MTSPFRNPTMVAECGCPYDPDYDEGQVGWHLVENHPEVAVKIPTPFGTIRQPPARECRSVSPSGLLGRRVYVRDAYLDAGRTKPLAGTIEDVLERGYPDETGRFDGVPRFVVMFDHGDPRMPPGGEFSFNRLKLQPGVEVG
jgi:hypothetical protein